MLRHWLAPQPVASFLDAHFGQTPFAQPGVAGEVRSWFDWSALDVLLASQPMPDVLVARDGRLVEMPAPRTRAEANALMRRELGIVIRQAELHHPGLDQLARAFALDVPGTVHVQVYATPADTQTFGWHYDDEDVFIVQVEGTKDYYMRANTVSDVPASAQRDFSAVRRETSQLMSARLLPGDWLYIPRRWWHLVHSTETALSISTGILPGARSGTLLRDFVPRAR